MTREKPQRGHGTSVCRVAHRTLYAEALAIIKREYATDLKQPEVARRIGASERALQRAFAEHSDLSFSQQLGATKMNVAGRLLRGTELPIGEIARRVGYSSHASFSKAFHAHYEMSPIAYREAAEVYRRLT